MRDIGFQLRQEMSLLMWDHIYFKEVQGRSWELQINIFNTVSAKLVKSYNKQQKSRKANKYGILGNNSLACFFPHTSPVVQLMDYVPKLMDYVLFQQQQSSKSLVSYGFVSPVSPYSPLRIS